MVAVKAYWTPGTSGNTGKLYARALTNKAWTLIGSGTTSPIDGAGLSAGRTYEFLVEEYVGDYSGLASNALRRHFGSAGVHAEREAVYFSGDGRVFHEKAQNNIYGTDGISPVAVHDGVRNLSGMAGVSRYAGISAPVGMTAHATAIGGSALSAGNYIVRARFFDFINGYPSDAGSSKTIAIASGEGIVVGLPSCANLRVDKKIVEVTTCQGSQFFIGTTVAASTGGVNFTKARADYDSSVLPYDESGHGLPPPAEVICAHAERMFYAAPHEYNSGTVAVTPGTAAVIGTGTPWQAPIAGRGAAQPYHFIIEGDTRSYKVLSHSSAGRITLDEPYAGLTATAATYRAWYPYPDIVWHSKELLPESVNDTEEFPSFFFAFQGQDRVRAMKSLHGSLIIYGTRRMTRFEYNAAPTDERKGYDETYNFASSDCCADYTVYGDGRIVQIPGERGAVNPFVVQDCDGALISLDEFGFHVFTGQWPVPIDNDIEEFVKNINWACKHLFHAIWDARAKEYTCWVCYGSETTPHTGFVYNVETKQWHTCYKDSGVDAVAVAEDTDGKHRMLFVQDTLGMAFFGDTGVTDGLPSGAKCICAVASAGRSAGGFTVTGGGLFSGSGDWADLYGRYVYRPVTGETRKIQSNTTAAVVLATPFATAPAVAETIYLGPIPFIYQTKDFEPRTDLLSQAVYLHLRFIPTTSARYLIVNVYEDMSATAKTGWPTQAGSGWATTSGSADIAVDLSQADGHVDVPISSGWKRYVHFRFVLQEPDAALNLLEYMLETREDRETDAHGKMRGKRP